MIISKAIALLGIIMVFNCKGELIKVRRNTDCLGKGGSSEKHEGGWCKIERERTVQEKIFTLQVGDIELDLPSYTTACNNHYECKNVGWVWMVSNCPYVHVMSMQWTESLKLPHVKSVSNRRPTGEYCTMSKRCSRKKVRNFNLQKKMSMKLIVCRRVVLKYAIFEFCI